MWRVILPDRTQALFWPLRVLALVALLVGAMSTHANAPVQAYALAEVTQAAGQSLAVLGDRQMLRTSHDGDRQKSAGSDIGALPRPALLPPNASRQGLSAVSMRRPLRVTLHPARPFSQAPPHLI
ncbi:hypothetical protein GCM10011341_32900 [Frigidibacter albus]|uniref:Uncharacterized protein n=2 Tax=Frigidibacter albus TaxID=1465486 RepID=A0A6L8VML7_9RHOB|nr:hypothetical protein [Frigidibacter albus]MZQ90629.1 hypothetical protein [Frigidibacter albus]GGH60555.1 hypothetical protein GCM10011341_32900 [Frigidibacter albus]